jgi:hypothetical protein
MSDLFDTDLVVWADTQANALRRRDANEIDWDHVAAKIESVGNEQRQAGGSLLINIMRYRLQISAWPSAAAAPRWLEWMASWQGQLERRLRRSPGLRSEIAGALPELYRDAVRTMYPEVDGRPCPQAGQECPYTLDELLAPLPETAP